MSVEFNEIWITAQHDNYTSGDPLTRNVDIDEGDDFIALVVLHDDPEWQPTVLKIDEGGSQEASFSNAISSGAWITTSNLQRLLIFWMCRDQPNEDGGVMPEPGNYDITVYKPGSTMDSGRLLAVVFKGAAQQQPWYGYRQTSTESLTSPQTDTTVMDYWYPGDGIIVSAVMVQQTGFTPEPTEPGQITVHSTITFNSTTSCRVSIMPITGQSGSYDTGWSGWATTKNFGQVCVVVSSEPRRRLRGIVRRR